MTAPPTIALSGSNPLAAGRFIGALQNDLPDRPVVLNPLFRYRRGGRPALAGTSSPDYDYVRFTSVNYGGGSLQANRIGIPIVTDASRVVLGIKGVTGSIVTKVNGQYASLTPLAIPSGGANLFYDIDFGSTALREIEVIASGNLHFKGMFLAPTATVQAATARGPRMMVLWDSFGEGSGVTNILNSAVQHMGDCLGWDDVWPSAVGATGLLSAPAPKLKYRDRIATDIVPFAPDIVLVPLSYNDGGKMSGDMAVEAGLLIDALRAGLPDAVIFFVSIGANKGGGFLAPNFYNISNAVAATCAARDVRFIHLLEQPLPAGISLTSTVLTAPAAAGATAILTAARLVPGGSYSFGDGSHVLVKAIGGTGGLTATIDNLAAAQAAGASVSPCGGSIWSGNGYAGAATGFGNCDLMVSADGVHPSDAGGQMIGASLAYGLLNALG
jgi:hypothetical protein